jgi:hypothetical protein
MAGRLPAGSMNEEHTLEAPPQCAGLTQHCFGYVRLMNCHWHLLLHWLTLQEAVALVRKQCRMYNLPPRDNRTRRAGHHRT